MNGLISLDGFSGFDELIQLFFAAMMGWMHSLSNWIWSMISGGMAGGGSWFANNWLRALIALVLFGLVMDWLVWLLRWRPYRLWFSGARRRRARMVGFAPASDAEQLYTAEPVESMENDAYDYDEAQDADASYGYNSDAAAEAYDYIVQPNETVLSETELPPPAEQYLLEAAPANESYDDLAEARPEILAFSQEPLEQSVLYDAASDYDYDAVRDYDPIYEMQSDIIYESSGDESGSRWPWRRQRRGEGIRTITGKPAQRRGLMRLASDDDEAIQGLPPMMNRNAAYQRPTMPTENFTPGFND